MSCKYLRARLRDMLQPVAQPVAVITLRHRYLDRADGLLDSQVANRVNGRLAIVALDRNQHLRKLFVTSEQLAAIAGIVGKLLAHRARVARPSSRP